jgi:hypothetical protein
LSSFGVIAWSLRMPNMRTIFARIRREVRRDVRERHEWQIGATNGIVANVTESPILGVRRVFACSVTSGPPRERALRVLKGDSTEYSRHMHAADIGQAVCEALRNAVTEHAARCPWTEVSEGDGVIVAHDGPNALINVALRLSEDLFEAPGRPQLHIAVDYGPVGLFRIEPRRQPA